MGRRFEAHPESAPGDFYVVNGCCTACGVPHVLAPHLIGWEGNSENSHCVWKRQPTSPTEIKQAVDIINSSEVGCHRYAGTDPEIINAIDGDYCDAVRRSSLKRPIGNPREFNISIAGRRWGETATQGVVGTVLLAIVLIAGYFVSRLLK